MKTNDLLILIAAGAALWYFSKPKYTYTTTEFEGPPIPEGFYFDMIERRLKPVEEMTLWPSVASWDV